MYGSYRISTPNGSESGIPTGRARADEATALDAQYDLPIKQRRALTLGGFPTEQAAEELEAVAKTTFKQIGDEWEGLLAEIKAPYKLGTLVKIALIHSRAMWRVLTLMKGKKFVYTEEGVEIKLWHGIDRSPEERSFSKKLNRAAELTRELLYSAGDIAHGTDIKESVVVDSAKGIVYTKFPTKRVQRIYCRAQDNEIQLHEPYVPANVYGFTPKVYLDEINSL